ncbi:glycosyltransferase family 2 protein [bacterium]|nr:glycosyltransferase family 2 protein [bacterium]
MKFIFENDTEKEIIIIDNGSHPPLKNFLENHKIKFIRFERGASFSKAYNPAFKIAKGQYILILNDDAFLLRNSLDKMIKFLEKNPNIDVMGPKLIDRNNKIQFQGRRGEQTPMAMFFYGLKLHKIFPHSHTIGKYPMSYYTDNKIIPVDIISGSCMLIKKKILTTIQGFDERFSFFSEDIDLCRTIRENGFNIYYNPFITVQHLGGESFRTAPFKFLFHLHRSYLKYAKKHFSKNIFYRIFYYFIILFSFTIRGFKILLQRKK